MDCLWFTDETNCLSYYRGAVLNVLGGGASAIS